MIRIAFDIGGTFTDFVLEDQQAGRLAFGKVSTTPGDPSKGVLTGLDDLLARSAVKPTTVDVLLHATTVATNAIIERKGSRAALISTKGFRDVVIIGRQKRYETYDLQLDKPAPLVRRRDVFEVAERVLYDGTIEQVLDEAEVDRVLAAIRDRGYASLAVALLHSYANPAHERLIARRAGVVAPGLMVSLSSDVTPKFREYERTSTTVANAYIKPIVSRYLSGLASAMTERGMGASLMVMQSNGGLISPELASETPVKIVESGPAAGVLMCAIIGKEEGSDHVLTFDMGGTTAKLGAIDKGEPAITPTFEVDQVGYRRGSGLPLNISAIELLEIGAGGGSIAAAEMGIIKVGPESAGADPGPICYKAGGTRPTVTDANVALGYIDPAYFNGGAITLDKKAAEAGIEAAIAKPLGLSVAEAAWGIVTMANANMELAMRVVSVERGRDPRAYAMVAFGGAGPLHAARLARALAIPKIIVPYGAGVGSALGLLEASSRIDHALTRVLRLKPGAETAIAAIYADLEARVAADLARLGAGGQIRRQRFAYMRYAGQGHEIKVDLPDGAFDAALLAAITAEFQAAYARIYGYRENSAEIEVVDWSLAAIVPSTSRRLRGTFGGGAGRTVKGVRKACFPEAGGFVDTQVIDRYALEPGKCFEGPAIVEERESTTLVLPGDRAALTANGNLVITSGGA